MSGKEKLEKIIDNKNVFEEGKILKEYSGDLYQSAQDSNLIRSD